MQYVRIGHLLNSYSQQVVAAHHQVAAANCILFVTVATVSWSAQLAVQLARVLVFTQLVRDLWAAGRKRFSGPWLAG